MDCSRTVSCRAVEVSGLGQKESKQGIEGGPAEGVMTMSLLSSVPLKDQTHEV